MFPQSSIPFPKLSKRTSQPFEEEQKTKDTKLIAEKVQSH